MAGVARSASVALVGFTVVTSALVPVPLAASIGQAVFKSGVDLVALTVTVPDGRSGYITGLTREDFVVFEDGIQQDLSFFAAEEVPLDLALLVDASSSMQDKMELVRAAASGFIRTLGAQDRAAIIAFNSGLREIQSLTSDRAVLESAIRKTEARGGTHLYNAVYVMLKEVVQNQRRDGDVRRRALVVLSDGEDTGSLVSFEDVLDATRRAGVTVYTVTLKSPYLARHIQDTRKRYFSTAEYAMKTLAQETGGRAFFPVRVEELPGVYQDISAELDRQYTMGYVPKNLRPDGSFRRLVVKVVSRPDARPRTRSGYFAPTEAVSRRSWR